jgi:hypothetical protein
MSLQTTTIQLTGVTSNTTMLTMGENTRVEDLTIKLLSSDHYSLTAVSFPGNTSVTSKIRTCVITADNSTANSTGSSDVTAVEASGSGSLGPASFSFNSLKGSTLNVYSNGAGNKRGLKCSGANVVTTRDLNVYVQAPINSSSTGSYIGLETTNSNGSIQCRSTTIGSPVTSGSFTSSDIKQTAGTIELGPGTDLVNKTAGGLGFVTYVYPTTLFYGVYGNLKSGPSTGYLWPGTMAAQSGVYPDSLTAYYRSQQKSIMIGMFATLRTAPGTGNSVTVAIYVNDIATAYTLTFGPTDTSLTYYATSINLSQYDRISVYVSYTGANANTAHDLVLQIDMF